MVPPVNKGKVVPGNRTDSEGLTVEYELLTEEYEDDDTTPVHGRLKTNRPRLSKSDNGMACRHFY